jgi:hypothetical protein
MSYNPNNPNGQASMANSQPFTLASDQSTIEIRQVSGNAFSTNVLSLPAVTVTSISNSTASALVDSSGVQYSGSNPVPVSGSVSVSGITNSIGATILNGEGVARDTWGSAQVGTWNINTVTGVTNSLAVNLVDSTGVAFEGANPLPVSGAVSQSGTWNITTVTGITNSISHTNLDRDGNPWQPFTYDNGDSATALRVTVAGNSAASVSATQVGTWNINTLTGITNSTASALVDSGGVQYSGSNPVPTKEIRSNTPSQSSPSVGITTTVILASNASRLGATIYNEGSAICYLKLGSTASLTSYSCQVASGGYYEVPFGYTGAIDGITSASTAQLRVTEIT